MQKQGNWRSGAKIVGEMHPIYKVPMYFNASIAGNSDSRRPVIRWSLIQSWFDRSLARKERNKSEILIRILPKERTLNHHNI